MIIKNDMNKKKWINEFPSQFIFPPFYNFWNNWKFFEMRKVVLRSILFMKEVHTLKSFYKASLASIYANQPRFWVRDEVISLEWRLLELWKKPKRKWVGKLETFLLISLPSECALNQNWVGLDLVGFRVFKNFFKNTVFLLQKLGLLGTYRNMLIIVLQFLLKQCLL